MATRDLSIRLSLSNAEAVKSALVELGDRGQGALKLIEAASDRAGASSAKFEATIQRLKESLDPAIRAQEQMARGQDMLAEALKRGSVTTDEHGRFLKLLKDRCAEAGGAVTAMGNAHGMATWQIQAVSHSVRASAEMLMAGASPVRTFAMEGMRLTSVFGAGSLAVMGWGVAVAALAAPVALGLSHLMKMEDEARRLSVALKAMGDSACLSVGDLKSVITSSSQKGPFGHDDAVAMVQALLKNNQLGGDTFRRVASLAGDFAAASGQDMATLTNAIGKGYDARLAAQKQVFVEAEAKKNPFADRQALSDAFDAKAESERRNREATTAHDLDRQIESERRLADARLRGAEAARQEGIATEASRRHEDEGLDEAALRTRLQALDVVRQRQDLLAKAKSLNPALTYQEEIDAIDRLRQSKEGALVTEQQYARATEDAALRRLSAEKDSRRGKWTMPTASLIPPCLGRSSACRSRSISRRPKAPRPVRHSAAIPAAA